MESNTANRLIDVEPNLVSKSKKTKVMPAKPKFSKEPQLGALGLPPMIQRMATGRSEIPIIAIIEPVTIGGKKRTILEKNGAYVQNQEQAINGVVNACLGFKQNFITEGEILYNLAMILKTGSGLKKSSKDAEYWFQKSCEKGYKEACNNL
mgnify:CR=1 FL=1